MTVAEALRAALKGHLSAISLDSVLQRHLKSPTLPTTGIARSEREALAEKLELSIKLFSATPPRELRAAIRAALALEAPDDARPGTSPGSPLRIPIHGEVDVSVARNEARRVSLEAGTSAATAVKIATSVSELARNIVLYASRGSIELSILTSGGVPTIEVVSRDEGPGIDSTTLDALFAGRYQSKSGLGKGIVAVKRIADEFDLDTGPGKGTTVRLAFRGAA